MADLNLGRKVMMTGFITAMAIAMSGCATGGSNVIPKQISINIHISFQMETRLKAATLENPGISPSGMTHFANPPIYLHWSQVNLTCLRIVSRQYPGDIFRLRFLSTLETRLRLNMPWICLLYTSPSPRDATLSRMPSSA